MNSITSVRISFAVAAVSMTGLALINHRKIVLQQREIRAKIKLEAQLEIDAIHRAEERIHERIDAGKYDHFHIPTLLNDFEFYRMTERFED